MTYVGRNNSNADVFKRANEQIRNETLQEKELKQIKQLLTCYKNSRMNRLAVIHAMPRDHPVRHITFDTKHPNPNLILPWIPPQPQSGQAQI